MNPDDEVAFPLENGERYVIQFKDLSPWVQDQLTRALNGTAEGVYFDWQSERLTEPEEFTPDGRPRERWVPRMEHLPGQLQGNRLTEPVDPDSLNS